jgi:hypothetical protein
MAKCEQGYLCEVCGAEVEDLADSDLYLRYVIGEIDSRELMTAPERHIRCNPVLAQFIVAEGFSLVRVEGPFDKRELSADDVERRERLATRGWCRLREISQTRPAIHEYPLPEFRRHAGGHEESAR